MGWWQAAGQGMQQWRRCAPRCACCQALPSQAFLTPKCRVQLLIILQGKAEHSMTRLQGESTSKKLAGSVPRRPSRRARQYEPRTR